MTECPVRAQSSTIVHRHTGIARDSLYVLGQQHLRRQHQSRSVARRTWAGSYARPEGPRRLRQVALSPYGRATSELCSCASLRSANRSALRQSSAYAAPDNLTSHPRRRYRRQIEWLTISNPTGPRHEFTHATTNAKARLAAATCTGLR